MSQTVAHRTSSTEAVVPANDCAVRAVAVGIAGVRREPDPDAEVVTQALLQSPVAVLDNVDGWMRVRLSDYEGWMRIAELGAPSVVSERVAVVQALRATVYTATVGKQAHVPAYATTVLPLLDESLENNRLRVALPGSASGWVDATDVAVRPASEAFPVAGADVALSLARRMLGVSYLWGGTSVEGLDCSGLAQLCCRAAGRVIRRDADQQYESIPYVVARGDLDAGDLIFFARDGAITHVALMLDASRYIHAKGEPESRVMINSLDPNHAEYSQRLADRYAGARRPFADTII
ncbi:MAG TPA: C40 family peptidase [Ktedonobacterales bacterium]